MLSPLSESESACISLSPRCPPSRIAAALRGDSSELGVGIVNTTSGVKTSDIANASGTPTPPPGLPFSLAAGLAIDTPPPSPLRPTLANTGSVLGPSSTATTSAGHEYAENDAILSSSEKLTRACRVDPASLCTLCLRADLAGDTDRGSGTCLIGINNSPPPARPPTPVRVNSNVSSGPDDDDESSPGTCSGGLVVASSAILSSSLPLSMWSWWRGDGGGRTWTWTTGSEHRR